MATFGRNNNPFQPCSCSNLLLKMKFFFFFVCLVSSCVGDETPKEGGLRLRRQLAGCEDDGSWKFQSDRGTFKGCSFVANNPGIRCNHVGSDGRTASTACPVTCNTCPTSSNPFDNFRDPFSPQDAPRNVLVLRQDYNDGRTTYRIRMRYFNSNSETVQINGLDTVFSYLAVYGNIGYDATGGLLFVNKLVDGMDDPLYERYSTNRVFFNIGDLSQPPFPDERSCSTIDTYSANDSVRTIVRQMLNYDNGFETQDDRLLVRLHSLSSGYHGAEMNGIFFAEDVAVKHEQRPEGGSRIRIRDVGTVEIFFDGNPSAKLVYYDVDGRTGGSLNGTLIDVGTEVYNLFFE